jgi:tetratricopeptide (TPR) repeat protein
MEIHELLRQYAQEHLENLTDMNESTKEAYASYFAEFMGDRWKELKGSRQISSLGEIEADIENVRAAWGYFLDEQNASQLRKFIHVLWMVYWVRGWNRGAIELFSGAVDALAHAEVDSQVRAVRASALGHLGYFMTVVGLAEKGYELGRESIKILETLDYPIELAFAYQDLTLSTYYLDRPNNEVNAAQELLKIAEASDDKWLLAYGLWLVNLAEYRLKNYAESKRLMEASMKLNDEIENHFGTALCLTSFGGFAIHNREFAQAKKYFTRCLELSNRLGFRWLSSNAVKYLGVVALYTGELEEAHVHLVRTLKVAYDLGLDRDIAQSFYNFARLRVAQDELEGAVELLSLLLGQPASFQSWSGGGTIRDNAGALLTDLENKLSQEMFVSALKRGESLDIDDVVVELVGSRNINV